MQPDVPFSSLDQGTDFNSAFYDRTVQQYNTYMEKEYRENYELLKEEWDKHYADMRLASECFLWRHTEKHQPCSKTTMAIVGPGFKPGERDYDARLAKACLSQLGAIILVDFSRAVNYSAYQSLMSIGIDRARLHTVQLDLTGGFSTLYRQYIEEKLKLVADNEDSLAKVVAAIAGTDVFGELAQRRRQLQGEMQKGRAVSSIGSDVRKELTNVFRHSLKFTNEGTLVPVDVFSLNMILAGTGAAADDAFWEKYQSARHTTDSTAGQPDQPRVLQRQKIITDYYKIIEQYNTEVAKHILRVILIAHPNTRIFAMSDFTTMYDTHEITRGNPPNTNPIGELLRIDLNRVKADLAPEGIEVSLSPNFQKWVWKDEPEHYHDVKTLVAQRIEEQQANGESKPSQEAAPTAGTPPEHSIG